MDLKRRWIALRNRVIGSPGFQRHAARNPLLRPIARRRSAMLFDLVAGFVYSQVLQAVVEADLLERLDDDSARTAELAEACQLSLPAMERLLRAAAALELVEWLGDDLWMLGEQGAALRSNQGAQAMIRHHRLLYRDLAEPLALLRDNRSTPTALSTFWAYGTQSVDAAQYSTLMAQSQEMVADQVLATGVLNRAGSLLDVGGGHGIFAGKVRAHYPALRLGVFDLPEVVAQVAASHPDRATIAVHPGNFFTNPIPTGYDCVSLVRILHDHDDEQALILLKAIRAALGPNGRLIIAEPMAGASGGKRMGDAYFGLYLWDLRSGRPRRADETGALLRQAGFSSWRQVSTGLPVVTSLIVALA
ncbi:MAG: methyltransferase [Pseudomonadota bacterium]|nr:methyltransferase [Pseudomonadota bacterium]